MEIPLGKIENYEFYVDKAFKRGKTKVNGTRIKDRRLSKVEKYKYLESIRISVINDVLCSDMTKILDNMPKYNQLTDLYKKIFSCFIDVDMYKKSLGSLKWLNTKISTIYRSSSSNIAKSDSCEKAVAVRNMYLARCSSVFKQVNQNLKMLDKARKLIKEIPSIKSDLFTVAISGFPNVGKSTLLGKMTDSKPEVKAYAFTTKGLMIGYIRKKDTKIQVIDTPGSLNRFNKMNNIEKMAHLCMKEVADMIIYVFDLTEPYPIGDQIKLYQNIKKIGKKTIIYFSKSDIIDVKKIEEFPINGVYDINKLKELIHS